MRVRMMGGEIHTFRPGECPGHPVQGRPVQLDKGQELEVDSRTARRWIAKGLAKRVAAKATPKKVGVTKTTGVGEGGK